MAKKIIFFVLMFLLANLSLAEPLVGATNILLPPEKVFLEIEHKLNELAKAYEFIQNDISSQIEQHSKTASFIKTHFLGGEPKLCAGRGRDNIKIILECTNNKALGVREIDGIKLKLSRRFTRSKILSLRNPENYESNKSYSELYKKEKIKRIKDFGISKSKIDEAINYYISSIDRLKNFLNSNFHKINTSFYSKFNIDYDYSSSRGGFIIELKSNLFSINDENARLKFYEILENKTNKGFLIKSENILITDYEDIGTGPYKPIEREYTPYTDSGNKTSVIYFNNETGAGIWQSYIYTSFNPKKYNKQQDLIKSNFKAIDELVSLYIKSLIESTKIKYQKIDMENIKF